MRDKGSSAANEAATWCAGTRVPLITGVRRARQAKKRPFPGQRYTDRNARASDPETASDRSPDNHHEPCNGAQDSSTTIAELRSRPARLPRGWQSGARWRSVVSAAVIEGDVETRFGRDTASPARRTRCYGSHSRSIAWFTARKSTPETTTASVGLSNSAVFVMPHAL